MLPPGPKLRSILSYFLKRTRDPLGFFTQAAAQYGDLVHLKSGGPDIFLLSDPELIKDVLVANHHKFAKGHGLARAKVLLGDGLLTSEGSHHRKQRRLVQPAFHHARL